MKATPEAGLLAAACVACCAPLIAGAAAVLGAPVLVAGGAVVAVGAGVAGFTRRRRIGPEGDTVASADLGTQAGDDAPS